MNLGILFGQHPVTPDTTNFMIFGYAVIFGVMFLYILSLYLRRRNLEMDMELLKDMEEE